MAIDLQRPALDVAPSAPPSDIDNQTGENRRDAGEAESASPVEAPVIHDDYCAIHDEYGTCTCGATRTIEEGSAEAE